MREWCDLILYSTEGVGRSDWSIKWLNYLVQFYIESIPHTSNLVEKLWFNPLHNDFMQRRQLLQIMYISANILSQPFQVVLHQFDNTQNRYNTYFGIFNVEVIDYTAHGLAWFIVSWVGEEWMLQFHVQSNLWFWLRHWLRNRESYFACCSICNGWRWLKRKHWMTTSSDVRKFNEWRMSLENAVCSIHPWSLILVST